MFMKHLEHLDNPIKKNLSKGSLKPLGDGMIKQRL